MAVESGHLMATLSENYSAELSARSWALSKGSLLVGDLVERSELRLVSSSESCSVQPLVHLLVSHLVSLSGYQSVKSTDELWVQRLVLS
jgi:hypothetical protein